MTAWHSWLVDINGPHLYSNGNGFLLGKVAVHPDSDLSQFAEIIRSNRAAPIPSIPFALIIYDILKISLEAILTSVFEEMLLDILRSNTLTEITGRVV